MVCTLTFDQEGSIRGHGTDDLSQYKISGRVQPNGSFKFDKKYRGRQTHTVVYTGAVEWEPSGQPALRGQWSIPPVMMNGDGFLLAPAVDWRLLNVSYWYLGLNHIIHKHNSNTASLSWLSGYIYNRLTMYDKISQKTVDMIYSTLATPPSDPPIVFSPSATPSIPLLDPWQWACATKNCTACREGTLLSVTINQQYHKDYLTLQNCVYKVFCAAVLLTGNIMLYIFTWNFLWGNWGPHEP